MDAMEFLNRLDAGVRALEEKHDLASYNEVLETLFEGIRQNVMIKVLFDVDADAMDGAPAAIEYEDGTEALIVLTNMTEGMEAHAVPIRLRALLKEMVRNEYCDGIILNPGYADLLIPKTLIKAAVGAGYQLATDEIEAEAATMAASRSEKELLEKRPVPEERFAKIAERIRAFDENRDDFLKISFLSDDELLFLQVLRTNEPGKRHLSFGFDMEDFGWDKPLILGDVLTTDQTLEILRKVCVDGVAPDPDKIEELEHFKQMG